MRVPPGFHRMLLGISPEHIFLANKQANSLVLALGIFLKENLDETKNTTQRRSFGFADSFGVFVLFGIVPLNSLLVPAEN